MKSINPPLIMLLILTPFLIAIGQILFKMTGEKLHHNGSAFHTVLLEPLFITALAIYGGATLLWIYILKMAPLSYAYSFMALTFVIVPILAVIILGETLDVKFGIGATFIITGLIISQT